MLQADSEYGIMIRVFAEACTEKSFGALRVHVLYKSMQHMPEQRQSPFEILRAVCPRHTHTQQATRRSGRSRDQVRQTATQTERAHVYGIIHLKPHRILKMISGLCLKLCRDPKCELGSGILIKPYYGGFYP